MIRYPRALSFVWGLLLVGLIACNVVSSPAKPPTTAPTPIVLAASATPKPQSTAAPLPTSIPPTQRPPAATAVLPATLPAQTQPDPNLCYFYPYGVNGAMITLYRGPGELNGLLVSISTGQFIVAQARAGVWVQVQSVDGSQGWIQADRGNLGGNCASLPQLAGGQECRLTTLVDTTVYTQPQISAAPFQMAIPASGSVPVVARSNGFWGFDPGVNWIPANVTGSDRLVWIAPGDSFSLSGSCDGLPAVQLAECRVTANVDQTVYVLPDSNSMPFPFPFTASSSVVATANNNGYYGFDPGVSGVPANVTGSNRLRWIAPGNITLNGDCGNLPSVVIQ